MGLGLLQCSAGAVWDVHGVKMAAEWQDALREFVAVAGAEEDRARFFLESAGWDLQVAPRGGPLRAGWGMRGAEWAPWSLPGRSAQSSLRAGPWPRPRGLRARLPRFAGPAWELSGQGRPGLLCRASVTLRARSVGETSGAAAVRVEESAGGVAAAANVGRWPGGSERRASRWSPLRTGDRPAPFPPRCGADGRNPARESAHAPILPGYWENLPVGLWPTLGASSPFLAAYLKNGDFLGFTVVFTGIW